MKKNSIKQTPSKKYLNEILSYDPYTGIITRRDTKVRLFTNFYSRHAGAASGYLDGIEYQAHRIIWKMAHGTEAPVIYFKDGNRGNTILANMVLEDGKPIAKETDFQPKEVSASLDNTVNETKYRGVYAHRNKETPFKALFYHKGETHKLGFFATAEEAAKAWDSAAIKYRGVDTFTNFTYNEANPVETMLTDVVTSGSKPEKKFTGVRNYKGKYIAVVNYKGDKVYLGSYDDELDAAYAWDAAKVALIGADKVDWSKLNLAYILGSSEPQLTEKQRLKLAPYLKPTKPATKTNISVQNGSGVKLMDYVTISDAQMLVKQVEEKPDVCQNHVTPSKSPGIIKRIWNFIIGK